MAQGSHSGGTHDRRYGSISQRWGGWTLLAAVICALAWLIGFSLVIWSNEFENLFFLLHIVLIVGFLVSLVAVIRARSDRLGLWPLLISATAVALLVILAYVLVVPVYRSAYTVGRNSQCRRNLKRLAYAIYAYRDDHSGHLPPADRWCDALKPYVPDEKSWICPVSGGDVPTYAMNAALSGKHSDDITDGDVVLLFESSPGWNVAGGKELLVHHPRHSGCDNFAYANGFVTWRLRGDNSPNLRWGLP